MSNYHLFWNGPYSQWYPHQKPGPVFGPSDIEYDGIVFNCAEQFMMFYKAIFFEDYDIANRILKETHPGVQKGLGRQVKNFSEEEWAKVAREIVYKGSECKYTQNISLCKELISTHPAILVEASPHDRVWGIGLGEDDPGARDPSKWKGMNWLGVVLTNLRNNIMSGDSSDPDVDKVMRIMLSKKYKTIDFNKGT